MSAFQYPLPTMEFEAIPYWEYLRRHELRVQECRACGGRFFPPSSHCSFCLSDDLDWVPVSGDAVVWATATMYRAYLPLLEEDVPYDLSVVQLQEGPKLWTNVVGIHPDRVMIGQKVRVVFDDVTEELTLARFRPVELPE